MVHIYDKEIKTGNPLSLFNKPQLLKFKKICAPQPQVPLSKYKIKENPTETN